jgi:CcmD family protein
VARVGACGLLLEEEKMFNSLLPVALIIIVLWVALFGYYLYVARQQTALREELESLQKLLDQEPFQE